MERDIKNFEDFINKIDEDLTNGIQVHIHGVTDRMWNGYRLHCDSGGYTEDRAKRIFKKTNMYAVPYFFDINRLFEFLNEDYDTTITMEILDNGEKCIVIDPII